MTTQQRLDQWARRARARTGCDDAGRNVLGYRSEDVDSIEEMKEELWARERRRVRGRELWYELRDAVERLVYWTLGSGVQQAVQQGALRIPGEQKGTDAKH